MIQPIERGNMVKVHCNMDAYGGGWTLVTLISKSSQDQWMEKAVVPQDLAFFNANPPRMSKMSDAQMNAIAGGAGATRWVRAGSGNTFYRMTKVAWDSNHGKEDSCGGKQEFYDALAAPATSPDWDDSGLLHIGCGGIHDGDKWGMLSGIHVKEAPPSHFGAYNGKSW